MISIVNVICASVDQDIGQCHAGSCLPLRSGQSHAWSIESVYFHKVARLRLKGQDVATNSKK